MGDLADLAALADLSPEPEEARLAFRRLAESWPAEARPLPEVIGDFKDGGRALVHLLAISPVSVARLVADPEALVWLSRREVHDADRGLRAMRSTCEETRPGAFDEHFQSLRRWKGREMLRLALRDIAGWAQVEQTTFELSQLAELCVRSVHDAWLAELTRKWGMPGTDFAVLAMGKFGGEELNYSSDIDVIFFFEDDGYVRPGFSRQEFFARFAQKIIGAFSANDAAGPLFRIDLRLRPEGEGGPLARSVESMESYYAGHGETWERMALIKARVVAGSEALGYEFFQRLQSFIYPRAVSHDVLDEISAIKGRIEREIVGAAELRRNVKLGYGGIREIEFVTQTLQLLHGAQHAFLQERNTLKALRALRQLELLPHVEMETLIAAYRWLRAVEHRLQIEQEAQTHTLPARPDEVAALGRSLAASGLLAPGEQFERVLAHHTEAVRQIFNKLLRSGKEEEPATSDLSFFAAPEEARKSLHDLELGVNSVRTRRLFARLEPLLLDWLRRIADPDATLVRVVRFVERYGARGLLYETLLQNPRLLELLIRLFDGSAFLTDLVVRRPQLIEEVARNGDLGTLRTLPEQLAGLARNEEGLPWLDWVGVYRRSQLLRLALRDVLAFASLRELQTEYSALAEACLLFVQQQLGLRNEITVIALGKFGGRELSYGADLDVLYIGHDARAAAELTRAMTQRTSEGAVFPVDARLRPEGESGPLACPLDGFVAYFEKGRGQLWEAQALTKARPVTGPQQADWLEAARAIWRRFGQRENLFSEIAAMHRRVVEARAGENGLLEFKTGPGGLMQAEFYVQAQQMRAGLWEPNTIEALTALGKRGLIPVEAARRVEDAYLFLRRCESVLRRVHDQSVSALPVDEREQAQLAKRCGFADRAGFFDRYRAAREVIARDAAL